MHDNIQLIKGDCLEEMRKLPDSSVDLILTDPPYHKMVHNTWDNEHKDDIAFILWLEECSKEWQRILKPLGSLYVFCWPMRLSKIQTMMDRYFNLVNILHWLKASLNASKIKKEYLRSFVVDTEDILFYEHMPKLPEDRCDEYSQKILSLRQYFLDEISCAGVDIEDVKMHCGSTASHWFAISQFFLPTPELYVKLREFIRERTGIDDYFTRSIDDMRSELSESRKRCLRQFNTVKHKNYRTTMKYTGPYSKIHPCQKPIELLKELILVSSSPDDIVLDCFMGSGSTGVAAVELDRSFIGIERDDTYYANARHSIERANEIRKQQLQYLDD